MMDYKIKLGKRYNKLFKSSGAGYYQVEAFYDTKYGVWLNAASWNKPSRTVYGGKIPENLTVVT